MSINLRLPAVNKNVRPNLPCIFGTLTVGQNAMRETEPDIYKEIYDLNKHVTTLTSASIVFLATFSTKIFPDENILILLAFVPLVVALLSSLTCMFIIVFAKPTRWTKEVYEKIYSEGGPYLIIKYRGYISGAISDISLSSFFVGMASLAVLSMRRYLL